MFNRKCNKSQHNNYIVVNMTDEEDPFGDSDLNFGSFGYHDLTSRTSTHFQDRNISANPQDSEKSEKNTKNKIQNNRLDSQIKKHPRLDAEKDLYQYVIEGNRWEFLKLVKKDLLSIPNQEGLYIVHLAVQNNQTLILNDLIKMRADFSVQDHEGKTVLHHAALADLNNILILLLHTKSVEVSVKTADRSGHMPIHTAAEQGSMKCLLVLIKEHPNINVRSLDAGLTPLHIAAQNNQAEAIRALMAHGASPTVKDDFGNYPIHTAAKAAAVSSIYAIVKSAVYRGFKQEDIMVMQDRDKNMAIHCAATSANRETVHACLVSGGSIMSQRGDGATPVHIVAAQGLLELAKEMRELQRDLFHRAINKTDNMKRIPLHWATFFHHNEMITFLINNGSRLTVSDIDGMTPILIAAARGFLDSVILLIDKSGEIVVPGLENGIGIIYAKDKNRRNIFHLLVLSRTVITNLYNSMENQDVEKLCRQRDYKGYNPLHYSVMCGNLILYKDLIKLGSVIPSKAVNNKTVLHLAAQYGRFLFCEIIMENTRCTNLQNETDYLGMSPLHLAARSGQHKIVTKLLSQGIRVCKDSKYNTPLHLAAENGHVYCMELLLATDHNLINQTNAEGNTALHLAAQTGCKEAVVLLLTEGAIFTRNNLNICFYDEVVQNCHEDVALAIVQHTRWQEVFQYLSTQYGTFLIGLIRKLPNICLIVLDRCVTFSEHDPNSLDFYVEYNFAYLNLPDNFSSFAQFNRISYVPLLPLREMVKTKRVELLSHPLCISYLTMKWKKYGVYIHVTELGLYMVYLFCITEILLKYDVFHHREMNGEHVFSIKNITEYMEDMNPDGLELDEEKSDSFLHGQTFFITGYCLTNMVKILVLLAVKRFEFLSFNLLLELSVYISALYFALPIFIHQNMDLSTHYQWGSAAIGIFLSWVYLLISLQRYDLFGIYIVMFIEIFKTLLRVLLLFLLLNVAFGLAFYILLQHESHKADSTPFQAIYHTFVIMLELDFMSTFNEPFHDKNPLTLHYPRITFFILIVYILLMPILLMNLLIGLAVGDIESVQRQAELKQLSTRVVFHSSTENKMPILRSQTEKIFRYHPNKGFKKFMNHQSDSWIAVAERQSSITGSKEENTFVGREVTKLNERLQQVDSKLEKTLYMMNKIMEHMQMPLEENTWDEGLTFKDDKTPIHVAVEDTQ